MTGQEIKYKIDNNNKLIEAYITPDIFILNNTVAKLLQENKELQDKCPHRYRKGHCIYCYKEGSDGENN